MCRVDFRRVTVAVKIARSLCAAAALCISAAPGVVHSQSDSGASGSVAVTANVRGVHLVVVDDAGEISQIWSNTSASGEADVVFRAGTRGGPEQPATPLLTERYEAIAVSVDWRTARGLVW